LPETLPILGLSDIVIFPGAVAPLLVETGPSIQLIDEAVAGDRLIGTLLQKRPEVPDPAPEDLYAVGCVVRLAKMVKFPDNTARVLVEGLWRIDIKEYASTTPYLRAKFELMRDEKDTSIEVTAMMRTAQTQFQEIIKLSPALSEQVKVAALNTEDPGHFTDLIAANLNLSLEDRQTLLETASVKDRFTKLLPMLNREHEVLTLSSKIQTDVASSIAKTQRDFFLREQMRAIQRELGEGEAEFERDQIAAREDRTDADAGGGEEGCHAGIGTVAANPAGGGGISGHAQLSRLDHQRAVGEIHARQD
jgi:ATP-dependent Lon protease